MLSTIDANTQAFLDSLGKIGQRMQDAQRQMSSGLKFSAVSDNPDQVSAVLQARADLAAVKTNSDNLGRVKSEVDASEQGLESAVSIMENVRTLATQGDTGTATADSRKAAADQIGSLLEELGGISRTTVEGRYVFSGDTDQVPPYTIDLSQTNPISAYGGSTSTREVQHPNGTRFSVAHTAQDIFDSADSTQNVFQAVEGIRQALLSNNQAAIDNALPNVISSLTYLNGQLSYCGTVQDKVQDATNYGQTLQTQLSTQLSTLQEADMTDAITEFQQASLQQQAALALRGKMPHSTLFDYLG